MGSVGASASAPLALSGAQEINGGLRYRRGADEGALLEGSMPFLVVPLAGPFGLVLLLVIAWLSL